MYNELKAHWANQYRLSANKVFADFLYYLERGGTDAREFIDANPDLVETVAGGPDEVAAIITAIENDTEAAENKVYFFGVAAKMLARVRSLLQQKFDASVRYCEQIGITVGDLNAETLLPCVRRSGDGSDTDPDPNAGATGNDPDPDNETPVGDGASKSETPDDEQAAETVSEEQPTPADQPTEEPAADDEPTADDAPESTDAPEIGDADAAYTEDDLKAQIATLVGDGASKSEIWQTVTATAEPLGWGAKRVWAYVDEIAPKQ